MKILCRRCAALDIHKKTVCACIREAHKDGEVSMEQETFETFTDSLEALADWLRQRKVRRVAMESTGVYWIPVWNVLESKRLELTLVNPTLVKALPGSKTDAKDAARIAELHQYGLLRGSFIPPRPVRRLRDWVRRRVQLVQDQNRVANRIDRLLQTANVKLASVASDILGVSGHRMLWAMAGGETHPEKLAELALGKLQDKHSDLLRAFGGRYSDHFRSQLQDLLEDYDHRQEKLDRLERDIGQRYQEHADVVARLDGIPGVNAITAWTLLAEMSWDLSSFPDADHMASWAGLCPGNRESGGKRMSGKTRKGNRYLRRALTQVGWAISRCTDGNFLTSLFYRIASRRGRKKANIAVAHRVLMIAYHIIRDGAVYQELGGDYFDRLHPERTKKRLIRRLENLGLEVVVKPKTTTDGSPTTTPVGDGAAKPKRPYRRTRRSKLANPQTVACPKCARWGCPCFHARYQSGKATTGPDPAKPTG